MADPSFTSNPVPTLVVRDVREAQRYYFEKLGFYCEGFAYEGATEATCQVSRGQCSIVLARATNPAVDVRPVRAVRAGQHDLIVWVRGLEGLARELTERGAKVVVHDRGEFRYSCTVEDLDGYHLQLIDESS